MRRSKPRVNPRSHPCLVCPIPDVPAPQAPTASRTALATAAASAAPATASAVSAPPVTPLLSPPLAPAWNHRKATSIPASGITPCCFFDQCARSVPSHTRRIGITPAVSPPPRDHTPVINKAYLEQRMPIILRVR